VVEKKTEEGGNRKEILGSPLLRRYGEIGSSVPARNVNIFSLNTTLFYR
jgi:hypothetical protein